MRHILLMLALAVSASGQQPLTYQVCDPTQHCGLWLQEKDDASLLSAWIEQQHQEWLRTFIVSCEDHNQWCIGPKPSSVPLPSGTFKQEDLAYPNEKPHPDLRRWQNEDATAKIVVSTSKPTNQPVWLIDGRRAYLTCPDDKRQDCTLSVSKPSGHAVSTHTKAGK